MRITVSIHNQTMEELLVLTNTKNKTEAVNRAISEFLRRESKGKLLSLKGKLHLENNWKILREAELHEA